jgi:hypothetical protein
MKRSFIFATLAAALLFGSCGKDIFDGPGKDRRGGCGKHQQEQDQPDKPDDSGAATQPVS